MYLKHQFTALVGPAHSLRWALKSSSAPRRANLGILYFTYGREYSTNFPFEDNRITEETLRAEMIYTQTQTESRTHSQKTPQHLSKANLLPPKG